MVEEAGWSEDRDPPRLDLLLGDDALGAAEVVDVAVGVDQAGDRAIAAVLAVEGEGRGGGLGGDQRVDHDDPLMALDHVHVGEVEAAQLVEARRQLEEAGDAAELALSPEARVGGVGRLGLEEVVALQLPDRAAIRVLDPGWVEGGDETAARCLEVVHR